MSLWFLVLNTIFAFASAVFGIVAVVKPQLMRSDAVGRFYPAMYAARAVPHGVATVAAIWMAPTNLITAVILLAAAGAQCGDIIIGACYRQLGMVFVPAIAALCHATAAVLIF